MKKMKPVDIVEGVKFLACRVLPESAGGREAVLFKARCWGHAQTMRYIFGNSRSPSDLNWQSREGVAYTIIMNAIRIHTEG